MSDCASLPKRPHRAAARKDRADFGQPVAVMLLAVLHFITDARDAASIVRTLMDALPPGSYLAFGHHTADIHPKMREFARRMSDLNPEFVATLRDHKEVAKFFDGLEVAPPSVVQISQWRADSDLEAAA